jgi:hypothetical protein
MKELLTGFWALLWAIIVSILMFSIGTLYSLVYSIWYTISLKKPFAFFQFWWRLIDGFAAAAGNILYEIAYSLDLAWNVNGEILEDIITTEENTHFTEKNISVSATTGKIEIDGKLNKAGKIFSKILNFAFGQKQHAVDAWYYTQAKNKLRGQYFQKK